MEANSFIDLLGVKAIHHPLMEATKICLEGEGFELLVAFHLSQKPNNRRIFSKQN